MRPRRKVEWVPGEGYRVTHSAITTADETFAHAVREKLDTVDPLPCPHDGDTVCIRSFSDPRDTVLCMDCGETWEGDDD